MSQQPNALPIVAVDMEMALLGAILNTGVETFRDVRDMKRIRESDFSVDKHRTVWRAMDALETVGLEIDILSIRAQLAADGATHVDNHDLGVLMTPGQGASIWQIGTYAAKVREHGQRRRLVEAAEQIARLAHRDSLPMTDVYKQVLETVDANVSSGGAKPFITARAGVSDAYTRYEQAARQAQETGAPVRGLVSGMDGFDRLCQYRFNYGRFMILFGSTGLGKSTLACNLMTGWASRGVPVLYVTLEMAPDNIIDRAIAGMASVPETFLESGELDESQWGRITGAVQAIEQQTWSVTGACQSTDDIMTQVMAMSEFHGGRKGVLIVDTMNSLRDAGNSDNPYIRITNAAIALDHIKLKTGWAVVGLGQQRIDIDPKMSIEKLRQVLRPNVSNIQNSRELAQKAEFMIGMYSAEYWAEQVPGYTDPNSHKPGNVRLDMPKSRYARKDGYAELRFYAGVPCFRDDGQALFEPESQMTIEHRPAATPGLPSDVKARADRNADQRQQWTDPLEGAAK